METHWRFAIGHFRSANRPLTRFRWPPFPDFIFEDRQPLEGSAHESATALSPRFDCFGLLGSRICAGPGEMY